MTSASSESAALALDEEEAAGAAEFLARRMKGLTRFGWAGGGGGGGCLFPSLARAARADSEVDAGKCRPVDEVAEVDDGEGDESGATIPSRRLQRQRRLSLSSVQDCSVSVGVSECSIRAASERARARDAAESPPQRKTRSRLVAYFKARDLFSHSVHCRGRGAD